MYLLHLEVLNRKLVDGRCGKEPYTLVHFVYISAMLKIFLFKYHPLLFISVNHDKCSMVHASEGMVPKAAIKGNAIMVDNGECLDMQTTKNRLSKHVMSVTKLNCLTNNDKHSYNLLHRCFACGLSFLFCPLKRIEKKNAMS